MAGAAFDSRHQFRATKLKSHLPLHKTLPTLPMFPALTKCPRELSRALGCSCLVGFSQHRALGWFTKRAEKLQCQHVGGGNTYPGEEGRAGLQQHHLDQFKFWWRFKTTPTAIRGYGNDAENSMNCPGEHRKAFNY